ncbi:hypothetical protein [Limosilactobacillus reuteri]|uniref:Uncharacterized protein n=1 Tax=Limosilactobacillus reuteri TaxID=1598 RepID=A0ABD6X9D8_LIMRT|nr:hypothetical protein [Limosilactobacillus reuteri]PTM21989.1 hypothetical protein DA797_09830 [Limosilactobacillus reuteri]PTM26936.1 hypothetical protein DA796_09830 [Limosilactobacillus reuteri]
MYSAIGFIVNYLKYGFKTENGQFIEGVSVRFVLPDEEQTNDDQVGASIQKMSLPIDAWESLNAQNLQTFSKVKFTFSGVGRSARLVKVEKVNDNG